MNDTKSLVLDIAMNLNRVGNWAADGFVEKKERIVTFLENNSSYLKELEKKTLPDKFKKTYSTFISEYKVLEKEGFSQPKDSMDWAEKMMTWGNILTHRANLIQ